MVKSVRTCSFFSLCLVHKLQFNAEDIDDDYAFFVLFFFFTSITMGNLFLSLSLVTNVRGGISGQKPNKNPLHLRRYDT